MDPGEATPRPDPAGAAPPVWPAPTGEDPTAASWRPMYSSLLIAKIDSPARRAPTGQDLLAASIRLMIENDNWVSVSQKKRFEGFCWSR